MKDFIKFHWYYPKLARTFGGFWVYYSPMRLPPTLFRPINVMSVHWLVGWMVGLLGLSVILSLKDVGWMVGLLGLSVIVSLKDGKLHFHVYYKKKRIKRNMYE